MAFFKQKQKNGIFILSLASSDRSKSVVTAKADADTPYESGTILVDITAAGADKGKFIRASEATSEQIAAITRAAVLRDRTFAETDTSVLVIERDAELTERLTDIDDLAAGTKTAVLAKLTALGVVLR
ncbi:hypothetical protein [Rhizobium leguminosarum]|uniref:hypothetical protein n=1 Tax=Rhizobium leguminosarum TaxID=384 RepID=UPI001C938AE4|nr:hypothetical protein [Rhizobium leguminosarum]MBY5329577.1 hypothetical protein [Rhizobium leguminosarum]